VPDLPPGANVLIAVRSLDTNRYGSEIVLTVPPSGSLVFAIRTPHNVPTGGYAIRITVEPDEPSTDNTVMHEATITLDGAAPLRTEQPTDSVPTVSLNVPDLRTIYLPLIQQ
jgi:hypothetical protein